MNFNPFEQLVNYILNVDKNIKIHDLRAKLQLRIVNKSDLKVLCLYNYSENIRRLILDYKYKFRHKKLLVEAVSDALSDFIHDEEFVENKKIYISYIPRHPLKSILYGGDHMKILSKQVYKNLAKMGFQIKFIKIIKRVKFTKSQFILNTQERKNNMKNAFKTAQKPSKDSVVFIIDDILKSSNTFKSADLTLRRTKKDLGLKIYFISISC